MSGTLYLVATPIGNLQDITLRAIDILKTVDFIYCEDSRQTGKLCRYYSIETPRRSYHEHNAQSVRPHIIEALESGQSIALVSDAGTPLINDPGYKLVRGCQEKNLSVTAIPGACAPIAALILSGLASDVFTFRGFVPAKTSERLTVFESVKTQGGTQIFFDTPHRLLDTLADIESTLGDRTVCIARELTKTFEEVRRGSASEQRSYFQNEGTLKGEIVLLIEGDNNEPTLRPIDEKILLSLIQVHPVKLACQMLSDATGLSKKLLYNKALELKNESDE